MVDAEFVTEQFGHMVAANMRQKFRQSNFHLIREMLFLKALDTIKTNLRPDSIVNRNPGLGTCFYSSSQRTGLVNLACLPIDMPEYLSNIRWQCIADERHFDLIFVEPAHNLFLRLTDNKLATVTNHRQNYNKIAGNKLGSRQNTLPMFGEQLFAVSDEKQLSRRIDNIIVPAIFHDHRQFPNQWDEINQWHFCNCDSSPQAKTRLGKLKHAVRISLAAKQESGHFFNSFGDADTKLLYLH